MYNKINSNQDQSEFNSNLQRNSEMVWGMTDGVKLQKVRVRDYNEEKKYSLLRLLTSWEHARTSESLKISRNDLYIRPTMEYAYRYGSLQSFQKAVVPETYHAHCYSRRKEGHIQIFHKASNITCKNSMGPSPSNHLPQAWKVSTPCLKIYLINTAASKISPTRVCKQAQLPALEARTR